jgi:general stress protein 26
MADNLAEHIERARQLLRTADNAAMATVNENGSPHNTPFLFLHDAELTHVYWGSYVHSLHSQNVIRTGQIFVVLYDSMKGGGLYMKATDAHALEGEELNAALLIHNNFRKGHGKPALPLDYYQAAARNGCGRRI